VVAVAVAVRSRVEGWEAHRVTVGDRLVVGRIALVQGMVVDSGMEEEKSLVEEDMQWDAAVGTMAEEVEHTVVDSAWLILK